MTTAAEAVIERPGEGALRLHLGGSWRGTSELPSPEAVSRALGRGVSRIDFDAERLAEWDTRLVSYVRFVLRECERRRIPVDRTGLPQGVQQLLALA